MKNCAATEDVRKKPGGIYMMVKVAVPEKFKLRIVPNVRTILFGGQQEIHYIGGSEVLPPPLENEKEREVVRWLGTDRDEKARKILIEHNLRLVVYIAKKFDNTGVGVEDLISIGTIGLIKAINTFNPSKKIKLATYASRCIENEKRLTIWPPTTTCAPTRPRNMRRSPASRRKAWRNAKLVVRNCWPVAAL